MPIQEVDKPAEIIVSFCRGGPPGTVLAIALHFDCKTVLDSG
jgi:hypothetical protein